MILPFFVNSSNSEKDIEILNNQSISTYQSNTCNYSLFEFLKKNLNEDYLIQLDRSSFIECYSKINGADLVDSNLVVYIGTNLNIDLVIQSIFWILIISFIPKHNLLKFSKKYLVSLLTTILIYIHLISEAGFYELNSKLFTVELNQNYLMFSLLLTIFISLNLFSNLIERRISNLINYFPYIFLFVMSFNSLNLNLIMIFCIYLGIHFLFENKIYQKFFILFIGVIFIWIGFIDNEIYYFDIDKLKGFSSSSYNYLSIIYWSLNWVLVIFGVLKIINSGLKNINIKKLRSNFLMSGFLTVIFSLIAASSSITNFLVYYFLGLNKFPSNTFESVAGNAWRGISSSAESIGEFYAYIILFAFLIRLNISNQKFKKMEIAIFPVIFYGLYRSNNFSAFLLLIILLITALLLNYFDSKKFIAIFLVILTILIPFTAIYIINSNPLEESSRKLIREGLEISYIDNLDKNEFGENAIEENRFLELLLSEDNLSQVSTSLVYLVEKYHYSNRNNIPNFTTLISSVASPINRSEKWGVFFGKYNPNFSNLLFGTGLNQLSNYYLGHSTKLNTGLVLPHSSILSYLIFIGVIGLLAILFKILKSLYVNIEDKIYIFLNLFILINLVKSDSLLYLNSFLLFIFTLNLFKLSIYEK